MVKKYKISIVILHYKAYDQLVKSLLSLKTIVKPKSASVNIVVVDNEAEIKKLKKVQRKFPSIIFLPQKENIGVPAGFNVGYEYSYDDGADFIMMLSPDLRMENNALNKLFETMINESKIAIASTKMLLNTFPPRIFFVQGKLDSKRKSAKHIGLGEIDKGQYDKLEETDFVNCPLLIRREVFKNVGYFNPDLFMYYEDIDWHFRIKKAGYKIVCVKSAIAWNLQPDIEGEIYPKKEYYNARNLLYFVKWNFPLKVRVVAYVYTVKEATKLLFNLVQNKNKQKSYYTLLGMGDFIKGKKGQRIFNI